MYRIPMVRSPVEVRELLCMNCGEDYHPWFAPNGLWNKVIRREDGSDEYPFLCPTCFTRIAVYKGVDEVFKLTTEDRETGNMDDLKQDIYWALGGNDPEDEGSVAEAIRILVDAMWSMEKRLSKLDGGTPNSVKAPPQQIHHTPGPWAVDSTSGYSFVDIYADGGRGNHVAGITQQLKKGEPGKELDVDEYTTLANAQLIAESPTLLKELQRLVKVCEMEPNPRLHHHLKPARDAIARATSLPPEQVS